MSTENGVQTLLDQRKVDLGSSEGQVELTFGLYESETFETLLSANAQVNVPDKVSIDDPTLSHFLFSFTWQSRSTEP